MHKNMQVSVSAEHGNLTKITYAFHNNDRLQIFTFNDLAVNCLTLLEILLDMEKMIVSNSLLPHNLSKVIV